MPAVRGYGAVAWRQRAGMKLDSRNDSGRLQRGQKAPFLTGRPMSGKADEFKQQVGRPAWIEFRARSGYRQPHGE